MNRLLLSLFILTLSSLANGADRSAANAAYDHGDYDQAMTLFLPLAEAGDGDALGNIGNMYGFGWGVPIDYEKAIFYWQKAAEKHVPKAMGNIASCFMKGECGLPKNSNLAASWYLQAAEHRHAPSMITLSALYDLGMGIEKDKRRALAWAGLAATNSPSTDIERLALFQLKQASRNATKDDMAEAQKLTTELIKIIDANVALYKSGHQF